MTSARTRLATLLEVGVDDPRLADYAELADAWGESALAELEQLAGFGPVDALTSKVVDLVQSAAAHLAASRFAFDQAARGGDALGLLEASRLADASRRALEDACAELWPSGGSTIALGPDGRAQGGV